MSSTDDSKLVTLFIYHKLCAIASGRPVKCSIVCWLRQAKVIRYAWSLRRPHSNWNGHWTTDILWFVIWLYSCSFVFMCFGSRALLFTDHIVYVRVLLLGHIFLHPSSGGGGSDSTCHGLFCTILDVLHGASRWKRSRIVFHLPRGFRLVQTERHSNVDIQQEVGATHHIRPFSSSY